MMVIHVGLVGFGAQMQAHLLPSLLQMPGIRIAAACDRDVARAKQIHRYIPDIPAMESVPAMLDAVTLDAIVMACPPQAQGEMAARAMQRGVSVFVAKPPCSTLRELQSIVDMARQCGVRTGVAAGVFRGGREAAWQRALLESSNGGNESSDGCDGCDSIDSAERGSYLNELHRFFEACRTRTRFETDFESLLPSYRIVDAVCERDSISSRKEQGFGYEPAERA
ncbi:Gfo/Idh/MocA family protein [Trinickia dinghuensis]|uniref:Gfo/Idh/MocA family oxidoreductase n=1 Tax=Trinickia dinghuensis TaxID=2291023 RepID=A0A3D8K6A4_9BURK|nr:Gfo/Idh/MocA family oxidoreductase [Trinickia dinghuensis]RDV00750.1 gfo/Idh/MocA family oxidoreductase [Trinickia dinghuensis]